MPGNKYSSELLLQGKFEFDQNSLSAAAQFTQELVKTIEKPIQEMAERIVQSITKSVGQGLHSGLVDPFTKMPVSSGQGMGNLPTIQGGATPLPPPVGANTAPVSYPPGYGPTSAAFQDFVKSQYRAPSFSELKSGITSGTGMPYSPEFEARNMALMMQKAQSSGVDVYSTLSPEQRQQFRTASSMMGTRISELVKSGQEEQFAKTLNIRGVEEAISTLEQHMSGMGDIQGQAYKEAQNELVALQKEHIKLQKDANEAAEQTAAGIQDLKRGKEALDAPERQRQEQEQQERIERRRGMLNVAGGLLSAGMFANQFPYLMAEREAATAGLERGSARALLAGDINRYSAIRELGGDAALAERGRKAAVGDIITQTGMGLIGSGILGGMMGGPVGMMAGVGVALKAAYDASRIEQSATTYREREIEAQLGKSQELRGAVNVSRARATQSFRTAQALGDTSLEAILYGGSTATMTSNQIEAAQKAKNLEEKLYPKEESISNFIDRNIGKAVDKVLDFVGIPETTYRSNARRVQRESERAAAVSPDQMELEYNRAGLVMGPDGKPMTLNAYAASRGVDYQQISIPMAAAMGSRAGAKEMQQAINLQSMGISPDIITGMYQGAASRDPKDTFNMVKDLYAEAVASGIEKSQLPRSMEKVAAQAAGIGIGGAGLAGGAFGRSTELAKAMFGEGYRGPELDFAQRLEQFTFGRGGRFGGGGLGGAMRLSGAGELLSSTKVGDRSLSQALGSRAGIVMEALSKGGLEKDETLIELLMQNGMSREEAESYSKQMGGAAGVGRFIAESSAKKMGGREIRDIESLTMAETTEQAVIVGRATQENLEKAAKSVSKETDKYKEAKKELEEGKKTTTPGGKAATEELAITATQLSEAMPKMIQSLADFGTAVSSASKAINDALSELYRGSFNRSFGNGAGTD